jgi:hypothetical protein
MRRWGSILSSDSDAYERGGDGRPSEPSGRAPAPTLVRGLSSLPKSDALLPIEEADSTVKYHPASTKVGLEVAFCLCSCVLGAKTVDSLSMGSGERGTRSLDRPHRGVRGELANHVWQKGWLGSPSTRFLLPLCTSLGRWRHCAKAGPILSRHPTGWPKSTRGI